MIVDLSVAVRSARANAVQTAGGTTVTLKIFNGTLPANCAAANSGTVLATVALPDPYLSTSADGTISKTGTWQDASADASGNATYWRLFKADGTTCFAQGDISTVAAGTGSMQMADVAITAGVPFTVLSFGWTEGNA